MRFLCCRRSRWRATLHRKAERGRGETENRSRFEAHRRRGRWRKMNKRHLRSQSERRTSGRKDDLEGSWARWPRSDRRPAMAPALEMKARTSQLSRRGTEFPRLSDRRDCRPAMAVPVSLSSWSEQVAQRSLPAENIRRPWVRQQSKIVPLLDGCFSNRNGGFKGGRGPRHAKPARFIPGKCGYSDANSAFS